LKTNGKSTPRDVILTTAFGLPFDRAKLFFLTLAHTGYAGRIVVFAANLGRYECERYRRAGAEVLDQGMHLHRVLRRPLQMLLWKRVRMRKDAGSFSPPWDRLQQANVLRWSLYRRYLSERRVELDRVLMVDLRDVCFQRDPFEGVDRDLLRIHAEEGDITVGQSDWNTLAMRRAFGEKGVARWGDLRVSCSGVLAGGIEPVLTYLKAFARLLPESAMPDHGTDQAIHTRLVHGDLVPLVRWQGNRQGDAVQLAGVHDLPSVPRAAEGRLLNDSGVPFAIIHQFDRHPSLALRLQEGGEKRA
jgi:hypothetical protein